MCGTLVCEAVDEYTEQLGQHPKQVLSVNGAAVGSMRQLARLLLGCKDPFIRLETGDGQVGLLGGAGRALMGGRLPGIITTRAVCAHPVFEGGWWCGRGRHPASSMNGALAPWGCLINLSTPCTELLPPSPAPHPPLQVVVLENKGLRRQTEQVLRRNGIKHAMSRAIRSELGTSWPAVPGADNRMRLRGGRRGKS